MLAFPEYSALVGARIRFLRTRAGISLRKFGMMVGLHYNQILNIEKGSSNPSLQTLYRIAQGLDVPLSVLLSEDARLDGNPLYWFSREDEPNPGNTATDEASDSTNAAVVENDGV